MEDAATESARKRARKLSPIKDIDNEDLMKDKGEGDSSTASKTSAAASAAKAATAKGSVGTKAGGGLLAIAPATGPAAPYVAGAGAGLMTVGAVTDAKNKQKTAEYNAKVERLSKQQNALTNLSALASRMKRL